MGFSNLLFFFIDKNKEIVHEIEKNFGDLLNVQIFQGNIVQIPKADCLVCPSNSYGIMDESNIKNITYIFDDINERVASVINNLYYGEQPVGSCFMLETGNSRYKYIAHVPTARYPKDVSQTHNAYTAFRALLTDILNHNKVSDHKIFSIACTPFCTGTGKMDPEEALRQMRIAYNVIDMELSCSKESADMIDETL
jgi:O-acetyl-ADP-ribose deacetylase (regulator of RNase III)